MDDSYSGLFVGYSVSLAIDPSVSRVLAIGAPPWTTLATVGLLLLISLSLGALLIILTWRERQLIDTRSDFIARVSHELRTPLTQIRMFTESILLGRLPESEDQNRALKIIDRETLRLSRLVENILAFSRSLQTSLAPEPKPYALESLLRKLKEEFDLQLESLGSDLLIQCDPNLVVSYNRDALFQLLTNLLDNALKYGPKQQSIQLSAAFVNGQIQISLLDQGPGIPKAERDRIWRPYYRLAREHNRGIAGTGIGLAVAKDLATALNADLSISESREGACFIVSLQAGGGKHG
jgi:signal transduction histidine kinase